MARPLNSVMHKFQRILEQSNADKRFLEVLKQTKDPDRWLRAYEFAYDRAYGKSIQINENINTDDIDRPTTNTLIETIGVLREELDRLRKGTVMAGEK